jgi:hydroxymethylbilane synthase
MSILRIGTRASALALWQANQVQKLIAALPGAPEVALVRIRTEGDVRTEVPLWALSGRGFFTKEIDRALLEASVDIAVHSLKDVSTELAPGTLLAAVLPREDPRDALLSREGLGLMQLPPGARIGTSSLRRRAFLAHVRPDVQLLELRGNVPTRIERLHRGDYDAIVLAAAGLVRLALDGHICEHLPVDTFPPAVSQGAIGVCARAGDEATLSWLCHLDDPATRLATLAERTLLRRIQGGCQVPLGALARITGDRLELRARVCSLDGRQRLSAQGEGPAQAAAAVALGEQVARELLAQGADRLIAAERALRPQEA